MAIIQKHMAVGHMCSPSPPPPPAHLWTEKENNCFSVSFSFQFIPFSRRILMVDTVVTARCELHWREANSLRFWAVNSQKIDMTNLPIWLRSQNSRGTWSLTQCADSSLFLNPADINGLLWTSRSAEEPKTLMYLKYFVNLCSHTLWKSSSHANVVF